MSLFFWIHAVIVVGICKNDPSRIGLVDNITQGAFTGFQLIAPAFPRFRASNSCISSFVNSKSYKFTFERMRAGVALFGSGT